MEQAGYGWMTTKARSSSSTSGHPVPSMQAEKPDARLGLGALSDEQDGPNWHPVPGLGRGRTRLHRAHGQHACLPAWTRMAAWRFRTEFWDPGDLLRRL